MHTMAYQKKLPVSPLKIIVMDNCRELGNSINGHIAAERKKHSDESDFLAGLSGYKCESYITGYHMEFLHTGERQAVIDESIRGSDLFIITDIVNQSTGKSPDDNFQDLKRIINACHGSTNRTNVVMPYLYEGRHNNRKKLESLDCALALQDMVNMGISNIITFDAHEPRVQNAIPIQGIDNFPTSYQFIEAIINGDEGLVFDKDNLLIVSPDVGGMGRVVFYSSILGVNMGMFYIRKDYSSTINGEHPIAAVEFLGSDISGKDIIIVDDMIDTGKSIINTSRELKCRGAKKVIIASTFGLFTNGFNEIDKAYEEGLFDRIYTTNLTYCSPELISKPYYRLVDMSRQIANIIISINHDASFSDLADQSKLINSLLKK